MVEQKNMEISEQEAQLYDRQIRYLAIFLFVYISIIYLFLKSKPTFMTDKLDA